MSSRIDEIRAPHRMETDTDTDAEGRAVIVAFCAEDDADWPCDIAHLLALVERLTAENAEFRQQMRSAIREVEQSTKRWESLHAIRDAATARAEAAEERIRDALDCLPRALDGSRPFSLDQRAEVMLAIESLRKALAAAERAAPEGKG